jgi:Holliday junction resolvase RusA-like endonuclease
VAGRVSLHIEVAEPKTKRATDLGNREKAVTDLLVSHGVIQGDDQRYVRQITLEWDPIDGVRVHICPWEEKPL